MKKRILPALLALCMVMSLLPVAFAADTCEYVKDTTECGAPDAATHNAGCPNACTCAGISGLTGANADKNCNHAAGCTNKKGADNLCTACAEAKAAKEDQDNAGSEEPEPTPAVCDGTAACQAETHTKAWNDDGSAGGSNKCKAACTVVETCLKTNGHTDAHDGTACTNDSRCPSTETHTAGCPKACGVGGCTKTVGHTKNTAAEGQDSNATPHNNSKCLGYNDDTFCGAGTHIAGCKKGPTAVCSCGGHEAADFNQDPGDVEGWEALECTEAVNCPLCAAWNVYVAGKNAEYQQYLAAKAKYEADHAAWDKLTDAEKADEENHPEPEEPVVVADPGLDYCECVVCGAPRPGMGTVVDENGNVVDPTEPTDPAEPEAPKAEDFTDMEDWMAADVQVALDKGWLEGNGDGTFNGRGVTKGTTIAAALARMDGETITGADWDKDALAWAEDQDVFEGIDLTGDSMARKDLVLVIWRMAGKPAAEKELDFTDVDGLEGDHLTAMQWAVENGIVKGNGDGTVTPDGSVNRAALCTMLARYDSLEK